MTLGKSAAIALAKKVLGAASFGDVRVRVESREGGHMRFARGRPTTAGDEERLTISVRASQGKRSATVQGSATDSAGIAALVAEAEALAGLAPENPEHMPPLGKVKHLKVSAVDRKVAAMGASDRVGAVGDAIDAASGVDVSGFLRHDDAITVVADRSGLLGSHAHTSLSMTTTCRTNDGTGSARAGFASHARAGLDGAGLAGEAADRAKRSKNPQAIDPGRYTVVLAPAAVSDLLGFLLGALSSRSADEGRSYFARPGGGTLVGDKLFADAVELWSDPGHPDHPASPIARDGRPHRRVEWIKAGRLLSLTASRFWAERSGAASIPSPSSIHMGGGTDDLDALVAGVDRGLLVSRFWYNRMLDRRRLIATGMTRDGTFLIEKGKIVGPVKNLRYNDGPITMLKRLAAAGKPVRTADRERVTVVPPIVVDGFHFSSKSDAI